MPILHPAKPPPQAPNALSSRSVVTLPEEAQPPTRSAHGGGRPAGIQPQVVSSCSSLFGHQDRSTMRSEYRRVRRPEPASARVQSGEVVPELISGSPRRKAAPAAASALGEERAAGGRSQCGRQWHPSLTPCSYRTFVDNPNAYSTAGSVLYGMHGDHERRASVAAAEASSPNFSRKGGVAAGKGMRWNSDKEPGQMTNVALFNGSLRGGQAVEHAIPGTNILLPGAMLATQDQHHGSVAPAGSDVTPSSTRCVAWAEGDSAWVPPQRPHSAGEWEPYRPAEPPATFLDDFITRRGRKPLHYDELGTGIGYAASARLTGGGAIVDPTPMLARSPHAAQGEPAAPPIGMPSRGRGPSAPACGGYGERHIFNVGEPGHRGMRLASGGAAAAQIAALAAASSSVGAIVFGHQSVLRGAETPPGDRGAGAGADAPALRALPWYAGSAGMATDAPARQQHPSRPRPSSAARGHNGSTCSPAGVQLVGASAVASWRHADPPPPDALAAAIGGKQRAAVAGKDPHEPSTEDLIRHSEYAGVPPQNWADHRYRTQLADSIATARVERAFTRKANAASTPRRAASSTAKHSCWRS